MCFLSGRKYIPWVQNLKQGLAADARPGRRLPGFTAAPDNSPTSQVPGMLNFYRRFLPDAAGTQAPQQALVAGLLTKRSQTINWTPALS